ncbi:plasmid stabilization system protein [Gloeobacter kilaueensis JS1]|uniref:Plasmid stabilization system protein n=1 Tax=Gloeobacter kilaueensis (strain ATCC BAA-2537 / CCAP 1431/1 / ULC 316 / JS1) TaxID=1183438 RepID=U5QGW3_GLOK1|nr:plasmid stabilization system protein [Gloeobacter kilaueensis JS1]
MIIAPEALEDLETIYSGIAADNPAAAVAFVQDLTNQLEKLAVLGITGASREWVSPGLRAFPYRERCFYFRIDDDSFVLLRVLHGKQDVTSQFAE